MKTLRVPVLLSVFALLVAPGAANATGTLDQQQTVATTGYGISGANPPASNAQTFTAGLSGELDQVELVLFESGATLPLIVEIRTVTPGGEPATVIASASVPASSLPPCCTGAFVPITFSAPATVVAGTKYAIVAYTLEPFGGYVWGGTFADVYAGGSRWVSLTSPPTVWQAVEANDMAFKTYVITQHPTTTSVKCSPNPVAVPGPTTCTATVTDTSAAKTTPTGAVTFTHTNTGLFAPENCLLAPTSPPVTGVAACSVKYAPLMTGSHEITASYGGDLTHETSKGSTVLNATTAKCESGDSDDQHRGNDNDQADGSGAKSQLALSGFSQPLLNSVQSDECDNDQRDGDSDHDRRGSDGD
jgi:hypothetical protein